MRPKKTNENAIGKRRNVMTKQSMHFVFQLVRNFEFCWEHLGRIVLITAENHAKSAEDTYWAIDNSKNNSAKEVVCTRIA